MYGDLEELLANELKLRLMNRVEIQQFAKDWAEIYCKGFTASNGWY